MDSKDSIEADSPVMYDRRNKNIWHTDSQVKTKVETWLLWASCMHYSDLVTMNCKSILINIFMNL